MKKPISWPSRMCPTGLCTITGIMRRPSKPPVASSFTRLLATLPLPPRLTQCLYLLHGSGDDETYWSQVGRANFIMDNLLAAGKARPALIVMPFGHVSREAGAGRGKGGKSGAGGGGPAFMEKDLLENVIPLVEKEYRATRTPITAPLPVCRWAVTRP